MEPAEADRNESDLGVLLLAVALESNFEARNVLVRVGRLWIGYV